MGILLGNKWTNRFSKDIAKGWVSLEGSISSSVAKIHSFKATHDDKPLGLVHYKQVTNLNGLGFLWFGSL